MASMSVIPYMWVTQKHPEKEETFQEMFCGQRRTMWIVRDFFQKFSIGSIKAVAVTATVQW